MRLDSVWAHSVDRPDTPTRGEPVVRLHSVVNGVVVCGAKPKVARLGLPFNLTNPNICRVCASQMLVSYV